MIFNFVKWANFRSYGDYFTQIDLKGKSLRLVVGKNGNGKTTMVDAILWCIYGKSLASINEVINRNTKKNCEAEVNFSVGPNQYSIVRYRNHEEHGNKLFLYKNQKDISLKNITDTQNEIMDIIQIPYHAMVSSIIFSSELYISFLRSKGSDRLRVFDGILNLKLISGYYDIIKKFRRPIQDEIEDENSKKNKTISLIEGIENSLSDYKTKIKATLLNLKKRREIIDEEEKELLTRLSSLRHIDYAEEIKKNEEYEKVKFHNEQVSQTIEEEKSHLHNVNLLLDKYAEIRQELEEIDEIDVFNEFAKIDNYNEIKNKNTEIDNEILSFRNKIINTEHFKERMTKILEDMKFLSLEIEKIKDNIDICPTCGQAVEKSLNDRIIKEKKERINILDKELGDLEKKLNEGSSTNNSIEIEILNCISRKEELPKNSQYEESYLKSLEGRASALDKRKIVLEQEIKEKEQFNKNIQDRIDKLKTALIKEEPEKSEHDKNFLASIKEEIESIEVRLREITNEKILINEKAQSSYDKKYVEDNESRVKLLKESLTKTKEKLESAKKEDKYHEMLQELFSNKDIGIKRFIINKMVDLFNDKINSYLPLFFKDNISIAFNKELVEEIKIDEQLVEFNSFSSGEKTRFELAIAFSLFMLVKTFFSASINLLVFDEILDMNLDEEGVDSVLGIILNLSLENTIIVISHREEYKENFNDQLMARKINGFSRLE